MEPLPRVHWRKCQHKESNWETSLFILKAHMTATLLLLSYAIHLHTCKNIFRGIVNTDKYETNIKTRKKPQTADPVTDLFTGAIWVCVHERKSVSVRLCFIW